MSFLRSILVSKKAEDKITYLTKLGFYRQDLIEFCIFNGHTLPIKPNEIISKNYKTPPILRTVVMPHDYAHYLNDKAEKHQCSAETLTTYFIDLGISLILKHTKKESSIEPLKKLIKAHSRKRKLVVKHFHDSLRL